MPRVNAIARLRPTAAAVALALIVASCTGSGATEPEATPTDFPGIAARMRPLGITLDNVLSGDAGCTDPELIKTAISFDASGLDQPGPVRVYLYIFRNDAAYEKLRPTVDLCAREYIEDPETYLSIDESPYVANGQGPWAPEFEAAFRAALAASAGHD